MNLNCPLCHDDKVFSYQNIKRRYLKCSYCHLIFVHPEDLISLEDEKKRYEVHENDVLSQGYKDFLYNIIDPVKRDVTSHMTGLDYGSGPYPMMEKLLRKEGIYVDSYDPFFNSNLPKAKYDFIILCEVIEHFHRPHNDLVRIKSLLKDNGLLFIQTSLTDNIEDFKSWYYKNDITHTSFFSMNTLNKLASLYNLSLIDSNQNVFIFKLKSK